MERSALLYLRQVSLSNFRNSAVQTSSKAGLLSHCAILKVPRPRLITRCFRTRTNSVANQSPRILMSALRCSFITEYILYTRRIVAIESAPSTWGLPRIDGQQYALCYAGPGTLLAGHRDRLAAVHPDECYRSEVVVLPALTHDLHELRLVRCLDPWPYIFSRISSNVPCCVRDDPCQCEVRRQ